MNRYRGEDLPPNPRIAVIANDALGNFVAATPLLQMLKFKWEPCYLAYFGGMRTLELQNESDLFDLSIPLHGRPFRESCLDAIPKHPFDLIVNLEQQPIARAMAAALVGEDAYVVGPCFNADGRGDLPYAEDEVGRLAQDKDWLAEGTPQKYSFLQSGFIGEIFCRLCYLEGPIPTYRVPSADPEREIPDLLIATAASLPEKLWPIQKWIEVVKGMREKGISIGLLGAKPSEQGKHWKGADEEAKLIEAGVEDVRGLFTLPQVVGALERAKAVLTIDNGILHLASATGTRTVGLFRHGIHRLWAPPFANLTVLTSGEGREVAEISIETVRESIESAL
ncbi:MAG: glycosyltransferase family 9 protein [Chlorobia bacterium]|nr:glycosyltransferase family 9 protein [Fimbriimonadaceae bacterium]